jgi:hypothetical protein
VHSRIIIRFIQKEVGSAMTRKSFLTAAAGMAATLATTGAVLAQTPPPTQTTPPTHTRGELGSARNIREVRGMLEKLIDQLQRDQADYGGWRVKAIEALRRGRSDLDRALQWDATHPH